MMPIMSAAFAKAAAAKAAAEQQAAIAAAAGKAASQEGERKAAAGSSELCHPGTLRGTAAAEQEMGKTGTASSKQKELPAGTAAAALLGREMRMTKVRLAIEGQHKAHSGRMMQQRKPS